MKVIDILNKIADGEKVPSTIKVDGEMYCFDIMERYYEKNNGDDLLELSRIYNTAELLNMEVKVLDKTEEIDIQTIKETDLSDNGHMEEKCVSLDYEREYERVSMQLKEAICELEEYKREHY